MLKIVKRLEGRPVLKKIIKNIGWLSFDKFFRLLVSLIVGIIVVRYLGPMDFGLMSLATAFIALFGPFAGLGILDILKRELVNGKHDKNKLIGSAFTVYLLTSLIILFVANGLFVWVRPNDPEAWLITFLFSITYIFQSLNVLVSYFESRIESKKIVVGGTIALVISNTLKILFVFFGFSLVFIVIASILDTIISALMLLFFYVKSNQSIFKWSFDFKLAKALLRDSWPLVISGAMVIIYMKIDQVMIAFLLNDFQVGIYSVAVKLSEFFFFIPAILMTSLFPSFLKSRNISFKLYYARLQKLFDFFTWISLVIIIPVVFLSGFIVVFLYGQEYAAAGIALSISILSLLAISMKFVVENYLIAENKAKIVFFNAFLGAVSNVVLNLFMIPAFGIVGAAIATVISYALSIYLGMLCFRSTRKVLVMMLKAFNAYRVFKELRQYLK